LDIWRSSSAKRPSICSTSSSIMPLIVTAPPARGPKVSDVYTLSGS
jgi:hypothetical protein